MIDMSRMPTSDMLSVRGIGVALIVSTSTFFLICLIRSLCDDAEPLFFVNDKQTEVAKLHVFRQQTVRADDDVDLAGGQVSENDLLFRFRPEAADHFYPHRKTGEPLLQRLLVLKGQHRGRRQKRHLLGVHDRLECGAHGDLRLAVPDVAAQQPIHRRRRFHVALDVGDRRLLVGCQVVFERVFELLLPMRVGIERVPRHGLARGVQLEQLLGHVAHGLLHPGLDALPRRPAEAIDLRLAARRCISGRDRAARPARTACPLRRSAARGTPARCRRCRSSSGRRRRRCRGPHGRRSRRP